MILEGIASDTEIVLNTLHNQWSRDPRDGKALDCLHFDEYCIERLEIKNGINMGLFSVEAPQSLEDFKESISKNVDDNWPVYFKRIEREYGRFVVFLSSDAKFYN